MDYQSSMSRAKPLIQGGNMSGLYRMKYEIANELAIPVPQQDDWGNVTSRDCGRIGGNMTRKLVELGKQQLQ